MSLRIANIFSLELLVNISEILSIASSHIKICNLQCFCILPYENFIEFPSKCLI